MSSRFGIRPCPFHQARRTGRTGTPRRAGRPRPRGGTARRSSSARPSVVAQLEALDHVVVEADVADRRRAVRRRRCGPSSGASTAKPWLCAVTSTLPVVRSMHRLVDAAVAVLQLVGAEAERPAEELVAEADPEVGQPARRARPAAARPGRSVAAGSPGPLEKNTPSGSTAQHVVERSRSPGSTCTSMPRSAIRCGVIALMPRSSAATVNRFSPTRRHDVGLAASTTSPASSAPAISPEARHPLAAAPPGRSRSRRCRPASRRARAGAGSARGCRCRRCRRRPARAARRRGCAASASWTARRAGSRTT